MKKNKTYIIILCLSLVTYLAYEWAKPKPVDWTESYSGIDKIPYGCYIMRDMLPQLFPDQPLRYHNKPIFTDDDSLTAQNLIFVNNRFSPDKYETNRLVKQAKSGKTIFISAKKIEGELADTLGLETSNGRLLNPKKFLQQSGSVQFRFTNNKLVKNNHWIYPKQLEQYHFTDFDSLNSTVLGTSNDGSANFIRIKQSKGAFYIHTVPYVFTNFFMRDAPKANYAFRALSYLPVAPTVWDEYYKAGRTASRSPMRYVVSHRYLKWAWITSIVGLFLFIIFRAKRTERIIPIIEQPKNTTVEFTRTIGRLYHQNGTHKELAGKKVTYLMDYIRQQLYVDIQPDDPDFLDRLTQRSGADRDTVTSLFLLISEIQQQSKVSDKQLWRLNNYIETFYQQTSR